MDKTAIRNFAIEARKILRKSAITEAGFYGITKDGCKDPVQKGNDFEVYETVAGTENRIFGDDIKRRANLVQAIKTLGFEQVIEETAYTWFNRIIAIRFMEVNNYLPTRVRVLSSETGSGTPDIITQADTVELNLTSDELEKIQTAKRENRYDDAFRMLFIKQCNELNAILPGLFEKTDDYMELLLKITYTGDGVIRMLVDSIPEDNFNVETEGQVEIIGWMYQFYNIEPKKVVDDQKEKVRKEQIPAKTQLFTPDWIVRYLAQNSIGRIWIEHLRALDVSVDEKTKAEEFGWEYYLPEAEQKDSLLEELVEIRKPFKELSPQDISCIDPCMGSGHILVYMFDVLMDIYRSEGFNEREAVFDILENNISGLDIDRRAYQLSYFALMMKARSYNRIFFRGKTKDDGNREIAKPKVYAIEESNTINRSQLKFFGVSLSELERNNAINQITGLLDSFTDAKEYGSILNIENYNWSLLLKFVENYGEEGQMSFETLGIEDTKNRLLRIINIGRTMSYKYKIVVTNPPYMAVSDGDAKLNDFVKAHYLAEKKDLYSVFISKCAEFLAPYGYQAMITQHGWMFQGSFVDMRKKTLNRDIINLIHLGAHAFDEISGEIVQTAAFVLCKRNLSEYIARYVRVVDGKSENEKREQYLSKKNIYQTDKSMFEKLPDSSMGYWLTDSLIQAFEGKLLYDYATTKQGLATGSNDTFLRLWFEVNNENIAFSCGSCREAMASHKKWFPCNKGGQYRKWYGNFDYVVDWENDGQKMKNFKGSVIRNPDYYFREGITWSSLGNNLSMRLCPPGFIFESKGSMCFTESNISDRYLLALLNSKVVSECLKVLSPTLDFHEGPMSKVPIIVATNQDEIIELAEKNIEICKKDWDSNETSWDFERHPLVQGKGKISDFYEMWESECQDRMFTLRDNEERIDKIFLKLYGIEEEDSDVSQIASISMPNKSNSIKSLISYAVGCLFGRYSASGKAGILFAGGDWSNDNYDDFEPDADNIIPITDEKYFDDDITMLFMKWIKVTFGEPYYNENIKYIADALDVKGNSAEEKIRNYFLSDFYKNHCDAYSIKGSKKRPIYWLFDSGTENAFKCLIYIHRYNKDTVGRIRSDYLVKTQTAIENALKNSEYIIQTSESTVDKAEATKKRDKYIKQLAEIKDYYQALSHIALSRVELDLDDGVRANYERFQGVEITENGKKKQKIDLLAKI